MNTKVDIKHSFETNNGSSSEKIQWKKIKEYLDEFGITLFYCGSNSYFGVPNSKKDKGSISHKKSCTGNNKMTA